MDWMQDATRNLYLASCTQTLSLYHIFFLTIIIACFSYYL